LFQHQHVDSAHCQKMLVLCLYLSSSQAKSLSFFLSFFLSAIQVLPPVRHGICLVRTDGLMGPESLGHDGAIRTMALPLFMEDKIAESTPLCGYRAVGCFSYRKPFATLPLPLLLTDSSQLLITAQHSTAQHSYRSTLKDTRSFTQQK
jgi:hypothetical protein